jgi:hypothetical protein
LFPENAALVDVSTVAREDGIDEVNVMLKAAATAENINLLAQRLTVPNAPDREFSTRQHHAHLFDHYIEPRFSRVPIREMKVLVIEEWLLRYVGEGVTLAGTTKFSIRGLFSKGFDLAATHEFVSAFEKNPTHRIDVQGVKKAERGSENHNRTVQIDPSRST